MENFLIKDKHFGHSIGSIIKNELNNQDYGVFIKN